MTFDLDLDLEHTWMHADLESIVCKFGGDPTISVGEEAICAKVYRRTDGQTDDGRRTIALAHSWNELKTRRRSQPVSQVNFMGHLTLAASYFRKFCTGSCVD